MRWTQGKRSKRVSISRSERDNDRKPTLFSIGMRVGINLVFLVCKPQTTVRIEDFLAQRGEELFKYPSAIDASP